jgi:inosine/xanthosine triphosphatase
MKTVIVASKNPVKLKAVEVGFQKMFPNEAFEFIGVSVPSGVPDQPMSDTETFQGAKNRVNNAQNTKTNADYYVGIEGGIEQIESQMMAFAWVVISSNNKIGKSKTSTFFLPPQISELIASGKELGEADDIVFGLENSKQQNGAVGILTGNVMTRESYYTEAVVLALIPFLNTDLY